MPVTAGQKMKTGAFTVAALLLLGGAIFMIGRARNLFGESFYIYGTFYNVSGLQVGNNIRLVGVNVGTVESIQIISDTMARVDMVIKSDVRKFIKSNAIASIGSDGLMGDKLIVISATDEEGDLIKDGAKIATTEPIDMTETLEKVDRIADNAEVITESLAGITSRINEGKGSLGRLLKSDQLAKNLEGATESFKQTSESIKQTTESVKKGTEGFSENMNALKHSFLLRRYYKKKERKKMEAEERRKAKAEKAAGNTTGGERKE